jgi:hypothetical protein
MGQLRTFLGKYGLIDDVHTFAASSGIEELLDSAIDDSLSKHRNKHATIYRIPRNHKEFKNLISTYMGSRVMPYTEPIVYQLHKLPGLYRLSVYDGLVSYDILFIPETSPAFNFSLVYKQKFFEDWVSKNKQEAFDSAMEELLDYDLFI